LRPFYHWKVSRPGGTKSFVPPGQLVPPSSGRSRVAGVGVFAAPSVRRRPPSLAPPRERLRGGGAPSTCRDMSAVPSHRVSRSCPGPAEGVGHQFCGSPSYREFVTRPLVKTPSGASTEKCRAEGGWGRRLRRPQCFPLWGRTEDGSTPATLHFAIERPLVLTCRWSPTEIAILRCSQASPRPNSADLDRRAHTSATRDDASIHPTAPNSKREDRVSAHVETTWKVFGDDSAPRVGSGIPTEGGHCRKIAHARKTPWRRRCGGRALTRCLRGRRSLGF